MHSDKKNEPIILYIRTSDSCNAKCFMCDIWKNTNAYLSESDMRSIIEKFPRLRLVRFTGGEPLLCGNLSNCISLCKEKGIQSSIITNGALLGEQIDDLASNGLNQVVFSIDGAHSETHDAIRGLPGLFNSILETCKVITEKYPSIRIRANTVVSHRNIAELSKMSSLLDTMKFSQWAIIPIKMTNYRWSNYISFERFQYHYHAFQSSLSNLEHVRLLGDSATWAGRILDFWQGKITPRQFDECALNKIIAYYNPFSSQLFPCNCLPHEQPINADSNDGRLSIRGQKKLCFRCEPVNTWGSDNIDKVLSDFYCI